MFRSKSGRIMLCCAHTHVHIIIKKQIIVASRRRCHIPSFTVYTNETKDKKKKTNISKTSEWHSVGMAWCMNRWMQRLLHVSTAATATTVIHFFFLTFRRHSVFSILYFYPANLSASEPIGVWNAIAICISFCVLNSSLRFGHSALECMFWG